ncbi:hypothetical protein GW813_15480 [bacterium]|nr:hypothetical protein [bacterium]
MRFLKRIASSGGALDLQLPGQPQAGRCLPAAHGGNALPKHISSRARRKAARPEPHTLTESQQLMILGGIIRDQFQKSEAVLRLQEKLLTGTARQFWREGGK